jgi:hypothetical protein
MNFISLNSGNKYFANFYFEDFVENINKKFSLLINLKEIYNLIMRKIYKEDIVINEEDFFLSLNFNLNFNLDLSKVKNEEIKIEKDNIEIEINIPIYSDIENICENDIKFKLSNNLLIKKHLSRIIVKLKEKIKNLEKKLDINTNKNKNKMKKMKLEANLKTNTNTNTNIDTNNKDISFSVSSEVSSCHSLLEEENNNQNNYIIIQTEIFEDLRNNINIIDKNKNKNKNDVNVNLVETSINTITDFKYNNINPNNSEVIYDDNLNNNTYNDKDKDKDYNYNYNYNILLVDNSSNTNDTYGNNKKEEIDKEEIDKDNYKCKSICHITNQNHIYSCNVISEINIDSIFLNKKDKKFIESFFNYKFELKLIYRGTRDGKKSTDFHSYCDDKGPTISFILTDDGYKFGGFTNLNWEYKLGYKKYDKEAFLFSLNKQKKYECNSDYIIYSSPEASLVFGNGHDIFISENWDEKTYSNFPFSFGNRNDVWPNEMVPRKFKPIEVEVFSLRRI